VALTTSHLCDSLTCRRTETHGLKQNPGHGVISKTVAEPGTYINSNAPGLTIAYVCRTASLSCVAPNSDEFGVGHEFGFVRGKVEGAPLDIVRFSGVADRILGIERFAKCRSPPGNSLPIFSIRGIQMKPPSGLH
jgi:hypothetical protein